MEAAPRFRLCDLEADVGDAAGGARGELCKALRRRQYAIIELPEDDHDATGAAGGGARSSMAALWAAADGFFALPDDAKARVGGKYRSAPGYAREEVGCYGHGAFPFSRATMAVRLAADPTTTPPLARVLRSKRRNAAGARRLRRDGTPPSSVLRWNAHRPRPRSRRHRCMPSVVPYLSTRDTCVCHDDCACDGWSDPPVLHDDCACGGWSTCRCRAQVVGYRVHDGREFLETRFVIHPRQSRRSASSHHHHPRRPRGDDDGDGGDRERDDGDGDLGAAAAAPFTPLPDASEAVENYAPAIANATATLQRVGNASALEYVAAASSRTNQRVTSNRLGA